MAKLPVTPVDAPAATPGDRLKAILAGHWESPSREERGLQVAMAELRTLRAAADRRRQRKLIRRIDRALARVAAEMDREILQ
jgi:hypothetical protein